MWAPEVCLFVTNAVWGLEDEGYLKPPSCEGRIRGVSTDLRGPQTAAWGPREGGWPGHQQVVSLEDFGPSVQECLLSGPVRFTLYLIRGSATHTDFSL